MTDEPPAGSRQPEPSSTDPRRVLLIGWDAADWKFVRPMIDAGEMPNLNRFLAEGTSGNIATLQPALSPMLWTSLATGKLADKHGILGFAEPDGTTGKSRPVTSTSRRSKALWNILSDRGRPSGAINWYASHPAERIDGFVVTDRFAHPTGPIDTEKPFLGWPLVRGSVWPEEDLEPLAGVRVHPAMITGEIVREFIPLAVDQESARWPKVAELRTLLAHSTTVHNAATAYIKECPWDFMGIYYDAIDRIAHAFMEYHPPQMSHISDEDFDRYSGVMRACYRLHDHMLGRLMGLVDDRTVVCIVSDHGFHCDELRPTGTSAIKDGQPVSWHRNYGMVGFWGPGIRKGETLSGASLLDIAPTVLQLLGLPIASDMDGAPLLQILEDRPDSIARIETYETEGEPRNDTDPEDAAVSEQMLEQLRRLGYMGDDDAKAVTIDRQRNLGLVYLSTGRPEKAAEQFEKVLEAKPDDPGARMSLLNARLGAGRFDECDRLCDELVTLGVHGPRIEFMRALIASARGDEETALAHLQRVERADPGFPGLARHLGQAHLGRKRYEEAEACFERALAIDPDDAVALNGLGNAYFRTGRADRAVLAHTQSVALEHHRPVAHFNLAQALASVERYRWAIEAIGVTLRMAPGHIDAHELASELYEKKLGMPRKAAFHRQRIEQIRAHVSATNQRVTKARSRSDSARATPSPEQTPKVPFVPPGSPVTIVSGLPRSGTSLMMQMLSAGGHPVLTDRAREADENNPRGYFELEAVKDTARDPSWLNDAGGKAVKVVHVFLPLLPPGARYEIVFMRRGIDEIVESQRRMLERLGSDAPPIDERLLREAFTRDLERTLRWIERQEHARVIEVRYADLMRDASVEAGRIASFLSVELEPGAMRCAIDPALYRVRTL